MRESVRLGHVAGVRVGVNWSVLVVFLLITFGLAGGRFPALYPDRGTAAYVATGLLTGLVFLASLLAHEISHAVVARRNGVEVEGITLWMLGGVAQMRGRARTPGAEFRISGVGPLVSLLLAGLFFVVLLLLEAAGATGLVVGAVQWLAIINLVLAVFNLFPAAPLDGGRILTAALWKRRGDRHSAAVTAARAGRVLGFVLVGLGLAEFLFGGAGGLWLVLLGGFLALAAGAEEQQTKLEEALGDVRVRDVMTPDPVAAPADLPVAQFIDDYVFRNRYSAFPLVDDAGRPVGLVTLNRVKQVPRERRAQVAVGDVACGGDDLVRASPDEPLPDLLHRLRGCSDGRAVVVRDDRVVGIVSPTDISRHLQVHGLRSGEDLPIPG